MLYTFYSPRLFLADTSINQVLNVRLDPLEADAAQSFLHYFFSPFCLEMASDVSSLGVGVTSGTSGPGAQSGEDILQRTNKRRPG